MKTLTTSKLVVIVAGVLLSVSPAWGHTLLLAPNGGEELEVDSVYTVRWQVTGGNYNPLNWDLWYSTESAAGPWLELAYDLPAGSGANGSIHSYDWTVPLVIDDTMWVRVRMDNAGADYYDASNAPFSIVTVPGDIDEDGVVGITDLLALLAAWGPCGDCDNCPADLNGGCSVSVTDLLLLLANWS